MIVDLSQILGRITPDGYSTASVNGVIWKKQETPNFIAQWLPVIWTFFSVGTFAELNCDSEQQTVSDNFASLHESETLDPKKQILKFSDAGILRVRAFMKQFYGDEHVKDSLVTGVMDTQVFVCPPAWVAEHMIFCGDAATVPTFTPGNKLN